MSKTKLVVLDNHTLGFIFPESNYVSVLHASVLRGSPYGLNPIMIFPDHKIRLANKQDFDDFRVHFSKAYENKEEYEYAN